MRLSKNKQGRISLTLVFHQVKMKLFCGTTHEVFVWGHIRIPKDDLHNVDEQDQQPPYVEIYKHLPEETHVRMHFHVLLENWLCTGNSKTQHSVNSGRFYNWAKYFRIANVKTFVKTFSHKTSFLVFERAIRIVLDTEKPFAPNNILTKTRKNKGPCLIWEQGINFLMRGKAWRHSGYLTS